MMMMMMNSLNKKSLTHTQNCPPNTCMSLQVHLWVHAHANTHKSFVEHSSVLLLHSNLPTADRLIHIYKAVKYASLRELSQTGVQW